MLDGLSGRLQKLFAHNATFVPKAEAKILESMWISCSRKTARALSETINSRVEVGAGSLEVLLINSVPKLLNPHSLETIVLWNKIVGSAGGVVVISSSLRDILGLADILLHKERGYFRDLSRENTSVIKELGDMLAGYSITALNEILGTTYALSEPKLSVNPYRAIESFELGKVYTEEIYVLVFRSRLEAAGENIRLDNMMLFKKENARKILELLSIKNSVA